MTIYRIHNDDSYYIYTMSTGDVVSKLGRENPFHLDPSPVSYAEVWKDPLVLDFGPEEEEMMNPVVPEIAARFGRMFFDEKAHALLGAALAQDGEFLPVVYNGGAGYIFNPLTIAEKFSAVDDRVTAYNEWGEVQNLGFIEEKLPAGTMIFRCEATRYAGIFCTDAFKRSVEEAGLVGIFFHPDLADSGGGATSRH